MGLQGARVVWGRSALLVLLASVWGCSGGSVDRPKKLVPVTGTVTLAGNPLAGARVTFNPRESGTRGGFGITDGQGSFVAKFRGTENGIEPGEYVITIAKFALPDGSPLPPGTSPADAGAVEMMPPQYSNPDLSQQVVTVGEGTNDYPIAIPQLKK